MWVRWNHLGLLLVVLLLVSLPPALLSALGGGIAVSRSDRPVRPCSKVIRISRSHRCGILADQGSSIIQVSLANWWFASGDLGAVVIPCHNGILSAVDSGCSQDCPAGCDAVDQFLAPSFGAQMNDLQILLGPVDNRESLNEPKVTGDEQQRQHHADSN